MAALGAIGLAVSVAQTLLTALQTEEVKEMCSKFRCEAQLEKLKDTMKHINALLRDVDAKRQGLTHEGKVWVERLKDAVYDIDDLLDEFATIGHLRKQMKNAKFDKKVGNFFSRNNKFLVNFSMSGEINKLREKLDGIVKDHKDYGCAIDVTKHAVRRPETCSTISDLEVIGREGDVETILHKLLSDSSPFVCIVGIGGLGKTTLAQLVHNHKKVQEAFSQRIWVCVSEDFGAKEILDKILKAQSKTESSNLEAAQREVKTLLQEKKYLLVLDDVWNESHEKWRDLMPYLVSDVSGSKIIVTTRSEDAANSIGKDKYVHKLQGLSDENSWCLFKRIAFQTDREDEVDPALVAIGKGILKKCVNVPLCIRVTASLLYGQPKKTWESFMSIDLSAYMSDTGGKEISIMPTLRFSYYQLTPELKSCFSFCSLFPKDHVMKKELLIQLWMAEGYLVPNAKAQSLEDVGDQYFTILLNRCFFQDIKLDEHGDVYTFKMHDLMHDLALKVAGKESLFISEDGENHLGEKIRHLCMNYHIPNLCLSNSMRTYICLNGQLYRHPSSSAVPLLDAVTHIVSVCKRLRVLSLPNFVINCNLPKGLGKLLHLRYLDLSGNGFELLPKSITKLHNLQILKLRFCRKLKELPEDMSKLANLKVLDIYGCNRLTYMPRGMDNLKNLHTLTEFVVGGMDSKQAQGSKLGDLQALRSLKGDLCIRLLHFNLCNMPDAGSGAFILKESHLKRLYIECCRNSDQSEVHERLVEDLCPNDDISDICIEGYEGAKLPSWATKLESDMNGLQQVISLSRFGHLKVLTLWDLKNVEYIEIASRGWESQTFFPVLEKLKLGWMPKLKGWWRGLRWRENMEGGGGCLVVDANADISTTTEESLIPPFFPRLHGLTINDCKSMTYFPPCPHVKRLQLYKVNEALTFCMKGEGGASSSNVSASFHLEMDDARLVNSVVSEFVGGAVSIELKISGDVEMKSMGIVKEAFERLSWGLKSLTIDCCKELEMEDEEVDEGMPWRYLQSLSSLHLVGLPKMVKLPKGFHYLTSLQSLHIANCHNLEEIGESIGCLTSLQSLRLECIGLLTSLQSLSIRGSKGIKSLPESVGRLTSLTTLEMDGICKELRERCRQPHGEDWPKIRHIPTLIFGKEEDTT